MIDNSNVVAVAQTEESRDISTKMNVEHFILFGTELSVERLIFVCACVIWIRFMITTPWRNVAVSWENVWLSTDQPGRKMGGNHKTHRLYSTIVVIGSDGRSTRFNSIFVLFFHDPAPNPIMAFMFSLFFSSNVGCPFAYPPLSLALCCCCCCSCCNLGFNDGRGTIATPQ